MVGGASEGITGSHVLLAVGRQPNTQDRRHPSSTTWLVPKNSCPQLLVDNPVHGAGGNLGICLRSRLARHFRWQLLRGAVVSDPAQAEPAFPGEGAVAKLAGMVVQPKGHPQAQVLAVDDCPVTREILRAALESLGYAVHVVDSGWAALEAADRTSFDAIVLDVEIPGLDGPAVGRALRSHPNAASALIAMHTSVDEAAVRAAFSGYDAFVPKPCGPCVLGERIDDLLRGRRS